MKCTLKSCLVCKRFMILNSWTKIVESFKQTIIIQYDIREVKFIVALKEKNLYVFAKLGKSYLNILWNRHFSLCL